MKRSSFFWVIVFLLPLLLGVTNFLIDCLLDFKSAIKNPEYVWAYFIYYLMFRLWLFFPFIILFGIIFKNVKSNAIPYQILYIFIVSCFLSLVVFKNDLSMFSTNLITLKRVSSYFLSGLIVFLIYRLFFVNASQLTKSNHNK